MRMWGTMETHSSHAQEELAESLFTSRVANMDVMMLAKIIVIIATKLEEIHVFLGKLGGDC